MKQTMADLVQAYNRLNPKKRVRRFSSLAAGIQALAAVHAKALHSLSIPAGVTEAPKSRSLATKATWLNALVAKARATRTRVFVVGHGEYASVAKAFRSLKIPLQGHIRFRMALKRDGARSIYANGQPYQFGVITPKEDRNGEAQ